MKWHGKEASAAVMKAVDKRIERAARSLVNHAKEKLSKIGEASPPGSYPFKQTGHLRRSIAMEMDRQLHLARVGTNVKYGKFLELGTVKMVARPWLTLGVHEMRRRIKAILEGR